MDDFYSGPIPIALNSGRAVIFPFGVMMRPPGIRNRLEKVLRPAGVSRNTTVALKLVTKLVFRRLFLLYLEHQEAHAATKTLRQGMEIFESEWQGQLASGGCRYMASYQLVRFESQLSLLLR